MAIQGERARHAAGTPLVAFAVAGLHWALGRLGGLLVAAVALAMLASAAAVVLLGLGVRPVLSPSMTGSFDAGSAVVTTTVAPSDVRVGDVIVFRPPGSSSEYAHRVLTLDDGVLTTKGDANPAPDAWRLRLEGDAVPRVVTAVPRAGHLLVAVQQPRTRTTLLAVLGAVVAVAGSRSILGHRPRPARPSYAH